MVSQLFSTVFFLNCLINLFGLFSSNCFNIKKRYRIMTKSIAGSQGLTKLGVKVNLAVGPPALSAVSLGAFIKQVRIQKEPGIE